MASAPEWKVYSSDGEYVAACKHVEDAAAIVALRGNGTTIRAGHRVVCWTEGSEGQPASESYDHVVETVERRLEEHRAALFAKRDAFARAYAAKKGVAYP